MPQQLVKNMFLSIYNKDINVSQYRGMDITHSYKDNKILYMSYSC